MNKLFKAGRDTNEFGGSNIAKNDLVVDFGTPLTLKAGFIQEMAGGDVFVGLGQESKTFESDNETVKQEKVVYYPIDTYAKVMMTVAAGGLTLADIGTQFDVVAGDVVAGGTSLSLVEVIDADTGIFARAK